MKTINAAKKNIGGKTIADCISRMENTCLVSETQRIDRQGDVYIGLPKRHQRATIASAPDRVVRAYSSR